jgi:hypothetical protein
MKDGLFDQVTVSVSLSPPSITAFFTAATVASVKATR